MLALLATAPAPVVSTVQRDDETIRVQSAVARIASNEICKDPASYGLSVSATGEISGKADVAKVLKALANANVSASLKGTVGYWRGIRQSEMAAAWTARNQCALSGTAYLWGSFNLSSMTTGRLIPRPSSYARSVQLALAPAPSTTVTQTATGTGDVQVGPNGQATVTQTFTNIPPPSEPTYMALGALCERFGWVADEVTPLSSANYDMVAKRARELADQMDQIASTLSQSRAAHPDRNDVATNAALAAFQPLREPLNEVLSELLQRHHMHWPHRVSDGLSLEGDKAYCGDLNTRSGLADFAAYVRGLADAPIQ
jgi:hypothetical protein